MGLENHNMTLTAASQFEQAYIALRLAEKRIYTDEEALHLPDVTMGNPYKKEWIIRKASCQRLVHYLNNKKRSLKILEVGCGNGWLSHQLSKVHDSNVVGLDINLLELQQAERVFGSIPDLRFLHEDLSADNLKESFDVIVFAASIQYFSSFSEIIETALDKLNAKGEIHIIDSLFYPASELDEARQRSKNYFESLGFETMSGFYFHRSLEELKAFDYTVLYNPASVSSKVLRKKNPFYWIRIKK